MKKTSLLMVLFAAMTVCLSSCSKDDFEKADLPAFDKLVTYLDRDASAVASEFKAQGFEVDESDGEINAESEDEINLYIFCQKDGKITSAEYVVYNSRPDPKTMKDQYKSVFDKEKAFRDQSGMTTYKGRLEDEDGNRTEYTTKSEFIAAVDGFDFEIAGDSWSRSTYSDIKTETGFGYDYVSYKVEKK